MFRIVQFYLIFSYCGIVALTVVIQDQFDVLLFSDHFVLSTLSLRHLAHLSGLHCSVSPVFLFHSHIVLCHLIGFYFVLWFIYNHFASILQIKGSKNSKRPTFVCILMLRLKPYHLEDREGLDTTTFRCLDISLRDTERKRCRMHCP